MSHSYDPLTPLRFRQVGRVSAGQGGHAVSFSRAVSLLVVLMLATGCNLPRPTSTSSVPGQTAAPTGAPTLTLTPLGPTATLPPPAGMEDRSADQNLPEIALEVELFYTEHWMRVRQTVQLTNNSPDAWTEVVFNVPINSVLEAFWLDAMSVTLGESRQEGTPSLFGQETTLRVPLPRAAAPGETVQIVMNYRVVIPPLEPTAWPPLGTTGWKAEITQAGEFYPSLVPYADGVGWQTWPYHPVGDPTVYPLVNASLTVTTQPGVIVASGGLTGVEGSIWRFHVDAARGIAFLASDRYEMVEEQLDGISLRSYYLPDHAIAGQDALRVAAAAIRLFSDLYGPYPYDSLTVAENGFFGGMEYSELISITDYAYITYHGDPDSVLHALVAHETAHQWWYGAVGSDQTLEPWLDESLAFYSELLYYERLYPEHVEWWWENRVDVYNPYGPVDATIYSYERSEYFIPAMYGQAARFLRDLRGVMGDEAYFAFVRDYYQTYAGQTVTAREFFGKVRQHYSGDLGPLLRAYFANTEW